MKHFFLGLFAMMFLASCCPHFLAYDQIDLEAKYEGGNKDVIHYVLNYIDNNTDGFSFNKSRFSYNLYINEDGQIVKVEIIGEPSEFDSLIVRGLLSMPKWSPAVKKNKRVASIVYLHFVVDYQ